MKSFNHKNDRIIINETLVLTLQEFRILEPNYSIPDGYHSRNYVPGSVHVIRSDTTSLSLSSDWVDGNRYIKRYKDFENLKNLINKEEAEVSKQVQEEKFNQLSYAEKRKSEYPTIDELVVALWENESAKIGFKSDSFVNLEMKRKQIKNKYPKG